MKSWLAAATVLVIVGAMTPLRAEEFPWCVELDVFTKNCSYSSRDECMAVAKDAARAGRAVRVEPPPQMRDVRLERVGGRRRRVVRPQRIGESIHRNDVTAVHEEQREDGTHLWRS